jgi:hypothetical protein
MHERACTAELSSTAWCWMDTGPDEQRACYEYLSEVEKDAALGRDERWSPARPQVSAKSQLPLASFSAWAAYYGR